MPSLAKFWVLPIFTFLFPASSLLQADEGMFPISEIKQLGLQNRGMALSAEELFSVDNTCLVDGICRVNGCTGSFVSDRGLIITNHHCAFDAIQKASSQDRDLLADGFVARNQGEEIPASGYTVRITQGYRDLSKEVLQAVQPNMPFSDRTKAIDKRRKELEQQAEKENPGLRAEVAEMFAGKTYVLFLYTYLKDVRLVFAPPNSIGNFGGENDNWEWPRHTGDFSFMRVYTAPDGTSADYSPNNIPYQPKRHVKVNAKGVDRDDFVFLLGYPGRTVRHKTVSFLEYERHVRLPTIVDSYSWQIRMMDEQGAKDRSVAIKHSSRSKSLANVEKRSRGQMQGLERSTILESRKKEEAELQRFIESDGDRKTKYEKVLRDIEAVYEEMTAAAPLELTLRELRTACRTLSIAHTLYDAAVERVKDDLDRETPYMNRNFDQTMQQLLLEVKDLDPATDRIMLRGMLERLAKVPNLGIEPLRLRLLDTKAIEASVESLLQSTQLGDATFVKACSTKSVAELEGLNDPAMQFIIELYPTLRQHRDADKEREGRLNQLYGSLVEVKQSFLAKQFIPDANATLRLTYGRVRGYSPQDAIVKEPITTMKGLLEKTTGKEPYATPSILMEKYAAQVGREFMHPRLKDIPVAILYDTDTTGGNSGSPVFNKSGELIGVNFDRAFEATINDFAWNTSYSRSIGVDIRYVLWVTGRVYEGGHLLKEMGVE